jgi:predicted RNA-binding protein with EMAP domain
MKNAQYSDLVQAAGDIRAAIMTKEMGDEGWDLRDEVLALQELVSQLATVVYQSHYIAHENVQTVDAMTSWLEQAHAARRKVESEKILSNEISACCGKPLTREYTGPHTTILRCSQCGKQQ